MIGFCVLVSVLAMLIWSGSYWISWEIQDVRTRGRFAEKLTRDCARLLGRGRRPAESSGGAHASPVSAGGRSAK